MRATRLSRKPGLLTQQDPRAHPPPPRSPGRGRGLALAGDAHVRRNPPGGARAEVSELVSRGWLGAWVSSEGGNLSEELPSPRQPSPPFSSFLPGSPPLPPFPQSLPLYSLSSLRAVPLPPTFPPFPGSHHRAWSQGFRGDPTLLTASFPFAVANPALQAEGEGRLTPP